MSTSLLESIVSTMLPKVIHLNFELVSITEHADSIEMKLEEYPDVLPVAMKDFPSVVLDGFSNPLELLHFSINGKPLYLKLYRRRWKSSGSNKHYSNSYDLHPEGAKATHEFAAFLKGEVGLAADEYVRYLINTKS